MAQSTLSFRAFLKSQLLMAFLNGLACGLLLLMLCLLTGGFSVDIDVAVELSALDGIWLLALPPALLALLALIGSPVAYALRRLWLRVANSS